MITWHKADLCNAWAELDDSKTYLVRGGVSHTRVDDPVTKQQKEWLQSELVARSNAPFMIAGRKADLRNGWAKLDHSKTHLR